MWRIKERPLIKGDFLQLSAASCAAVLNCFSFCMDCGREKAEKLECAREKCRAFNWTWNPSSPRAGHFQIFPMLPPATDLRDFTYVINFTCVVNFTYVIFYPSLKIPLLPVTRRGEFLRKFFHIFASGEIISNFFITENFSLHYTKIHFSCQKRYLFDLNSLLLLMICWKSPKKPERSWFTKRILQFFWT